MLLMGLRKGKWWEQLWFLPFEVVLNSLRFRLLPKNHPREWRVGWRFLHAYASLLVKVYEDSEVCLLRARTKTTMNAFWGTFACISHSSRSRGIFLAQHQWSFWTPIVLRFKRDYEKDRVCPTWDARRKVWGKKSLWVGFAAFPKPLGEGEERYSSYNVHVSATSYSELMHREFPDHRTPQ